MKEKVELDEWGLPGMAVYSDGYIIDYTKMPIWFKKDRKEVKERLERIAKEKTK